MRPKASIIIVNYNGEKLIADCLRALEKQSFQDFEIIIVDNASRDGSIPELKHFLSHATDADRIRLVALDSNTGFTGGNTKGLEYARGEYIALLNNDTEADIHWLRELVNAMESHPEVGICASKMIVHGTNMIDTAGDGFSTSLKGFKCGENKLENDPAYIVPRYSFGACAGAALYRKKMIGEIGFLDNDFFLIHEDTDLNFRAQLTGWKVLYVPPAIVHHKVRSSIGHMSDLAVYYSLRNNEFVRIKNVPFGLFLRYLPELLIGSITEFAYFAVKHKRFKLFFRAKIDAMKGLPAAYKKRAHIMNMKKASNSYMRSVLTPIWQVDFFLPKVKKFFYD